MNKKKNAIVSVSGGMDSSTLLLRCLNEYENVVALSFDYNQKHRVELERAQSLVAYLKDMGFKIKHQIIKLDGLGALLNSTLVEGGADVPEGHYENDNMKETVVPNRNKMFASIVQAVALSVADKTEEDCDIALGIHAGDHAIYPDCRQEFRDADDAAFRLGNWGAERVYYYTPYLQEDKFNILRDGERLCEELGLDFDEVYSRTLTSYKPIQIGSTWYSDSYSASSVERVEAFIKLSRPDPAAYADKTGPISWDTVKSHVEAVLVGH